MRKITILITIITNGILLGQPIIDGNASEWTGTAPNVNSSLYSSETVFGTVNLNEWIWTDDNGDNRTDNFGFVDGLKQDIRELRISSDNDYLYYLLKLPSNIDHTPGDGSIQFQISLRRNSSTSSTEYTAQWSDTQVPNATSPGGTVSDARWDYNIVTRTGSSNNNHNIWDQFYSLNITGLYALNAANGIIEGRVPWSALGGTPGANTFYFTFAIYRANTSDDTFDTGADNSKGDCLDYITTTSGNTYGALIGISSGGTNNIGRMDYAANIDFLSINQPLPVELSSFSVSIIGNQIKLNWRTETELNNYGFEVERNISIQQTLGSNWEKIGFVEGSGNSNSTKSYEFIDKNINTGKYSYRLKQIDNDGTFEYSKVIEIDLGTPIQFKLSQNFPNPLNPSTTIKYSIPKSSQVTLKIFNTLGEELETLVNEDKPVGTYEVNWNAANLPSGVYFYRLQAGDFVETKKMILIK